VLLLFGLALGIYALGAWVSPIRREGVLVRTPS